MAGTSELQSLALGSPLLEDIKALKFEGKVTGLKHMVPFSICHFAELSRGSGIQVEDPLKSQSSEAKNQKIKTLEQIEIYSLITRRGRYHRKGQLI